MKTWPIYLCSFESSTNPPYAGPSYVIQFTQHSSIELSILSATKVDVGPQTHFTQLCTQGTLSSRFRAKKALNVELLPDRLQWFIAGPIIGLPVVALYAVANKHLAVTTSYLQVMTFVRSPRTAEMWRVWFFAGLVGGALIASFLRGGPSPNLN
mgnify:CR=1 FL=1